MSLANHPMGTPGTTRLLLDGEPGAIPPAPPPRAAERGCLVGSRIGAYEITKRLGVGGVGEVFKAVDVMLKRDVAIKVLRDELAADPLFLERFRREAQLHAKLSHHNVAAVHAFLHEGGKQFMVMEFIAGISLDEFIRSGGPVPVPRALAIFRAALDGIEHAHGCGIVHRDIKPANIMLADDGQVKVMDFGIARALDGQDQLTRHGHVAGTARAMAPEQIRGRPADVRSDIYSLGIVLYTLLAGRAPFDSDNDFALMKMQLEQTPPPLDTLVGGVPPAVQAAVMRALEKDPAARFESAAAFAQAIDACMGESAAAAALPPAATRSFNAFLDAGTMINPALQHETQLGPPESAPTERRALPKPPRRRPRLGRPAAAVALATIALGALGAGAAALWPQLALRDGADVARLVSTGAATAVSAIAPAPERPVDPSPSPIDPSGASAAPAADALPPVAPAAPAAPVAPVQPALAIERWSVDGRAIASTSFKPGERIQLRVTSNTDAHVYCYLQDESRRIVRFYPNRFSKSARVRADVPLDIPGSMRFELVANSRRVAETVACFATERDVLGDLPAAAVGTDFVKLPAASLDEVRLAFASVGAQPPAQASFRIAFN
jgi:serine/threonine-protein kinase